MCRWQQCSISVLKETYFKLFLYLIFRLLNQYAFKLNLLINLREHLLIESGYQCRNGKFQETFFREIIKKNKSIYFKFINSFRSDTVKKVVCFI